MHSLMSCKANSSLIATPDKNWNIASTPLSYHSPDLYGITLLLFFFSFII